MARESAARVSSDRRPFPSVNGVSHFLTLTAVTLALGLFITLSPCHLVTLPACHGEEGEAAPMFRRLLLPPERLPEELKRVREGALVRLPVAEFDALVEEVARVGKRRSPPRLLEARYHATLKDESLFGEGQWKVVHSGPGPALLALHPFNLALRQARFENGDALIAAFDGKAPALLLEAPGQRTVSLDWSARAESGPDGLQFHLELPPCPVAVLELDVPAGRAVTALNDGALLSGPHEADTANLSRWQIVCGGRLRVDRQRVDIRIHPSERSAAGAVSPPVFFVHQKTTQKLNPQGLDAAFELTLEASRRGIRELICECDAELRLRDVVGPMVDGYSFQAGEGRKPSRLTIHLREPVRSGTWQILCIAPLNGGTLDRQGAKPTSSAGTRAAPVAWRSPGLRLVNSVPRGETLTLWLNPDLRVEGWDAGSFRLVSSDLDRATGSQVLTLLGGSAGPLRRPSARLQAYNVDFTTQQLAWWRCTSSGMALTVQIGWDVRQGQLFQLPVQLPIGWDVEKVETTPTALLSDWHIRKTAEKTTLFVDLVNALGPRPSKDGEPANVVEPRPPSTPRPRLPALTVHLRQGWSAFVSEKSIPFPDVLPLGARFREGALALDCDEQLFHLRVKTSAQSTEPEGEGPWGQQLPEYYYRYRGNHPSGTISIRSRPPRLRAKCTSEVFVAAGEVAVETHLQLETESGSPNTIELAVSGGDGGQWQWRNEASPRGEEAAANRVRRAVRAHDKETSYALQLLAASRPLQAAVVQAAQPGGERWLLTLDRPLRVREPLILQTRRRLQPRNNRWAVPLPVVVGAERMEGEIVLHLEGSGLSPVHSVGLRESASTAEISPATPRTFHYGQGEVSLSLAGVAQGPDRTGGASVSPVGGTIDAARLITYAGCDDVLRNHFSFQVANWSERFLTLRLPPRSRPIAVLIDGRWLPRLIPAPTDTRGQSLPAVSILQEAGSEEEPVELALQMPTRENTATGNRAVHFEIVYMRSLPDGLLWQSLDAPAPQLPVAPLTFRRIWRLSPKLSPLHQERYQCLPGAAGKMSVADSPRRSADLFYLPGSLARFDMLAKQPQGNNGRRPMPLDFELEASNWNEWEPIAGFVEERLTVIRRPGVTAFGLALALLMALLFRLLLFPSQQELPRRTAFLGRPNYPKGPSGGSGFLTGAIQRFVRHRVALLLLALALFGLCVLWLPAALRDLAWWPLLSSSAVAVLAYMRVLFRKRPDPQSSLNQPKGTGSSAAMMGMLILTFFGWNSRAAAPAPVLVYIVPAPGNAAGKQTVLAPVELVDRLKTLARPAPLAPAGPQTVLLDASYEGELVDEGKQAEFVAVFSAYTRSDKASTLSMPLAGVQLVGEVLVDGARVAPVAAPQSGFSLRVRGRGRHKIELRFRVPVTGTIEDRNLLFPVPPLLRSRLSWRVPSGAVDPQVLVKNGAQWLTRDNRGQLLEADLGALPLPVHLRWYQPSRPTRASYQAAFVWDLGPEVNRLTTWLRCRVEQGAVQTLELDLPADLEVSSASAQRTGPGAALPWRTRVQLRNWCVTHAGNKRLLHLEFPYPISGDFQVTLELLPRAPLPSVASLPLPSLRGIHAGGPHYLAYRARPGLHAQRESLQNLTRIDNNEFAPDWPNGPRLEASFQGVAFRFPPDRRPQLFLRLEHTPPVVEGEVDVTIRAAAQRAEIEAAAEVSATAKNLTAIEWELPPLCVLSEVTGEDVRTWKQDGSHLLVWLNRSTETTRIHLHGWLPLPARAGHPNLEMSGPRLLHAGRQHTRLHLTAAADLALTEVRTRNLQPIKSESGRKEYFSDFETRDSTYQVTCRVQPAAKAIAQVLTVAEVVERELRFTTTVDYTVTQGVLRQVRVRLRNWQEENVELQAERLTLRPGPRRIMGERSWVLPLQAGVRGHYQVTLRGSMPLEKAAEGVPMPDVLVQGVERTDYFLAVAGNELSGQAKGTLQLLQSPRRALSLWPDAALQLERSGGHVWRIDGSEWQLHLQPQTRALQPPPLRFYLIEQWAAVADGRHWLHEARCWLRYEAHTDLIVNFAAPARVLAASVDGTTSTPLQQGATSLCLPLPRRPVVRCICLRWMYDPPEPLNHPNLASLQLPGATEGAALWTVIVPPGWQAPLIASAGWQGATREAATALWRAHGQLLIRHDLAKEQPDTVLTTAQTAAQHRFAQYCQQARNALDRDGDDGAAAGPQGQSLTRWLEDMQDKDRMLTEKNSTALVAESGEPAILAAWTPDFDDTGGIPISWQARPDSEAGTFQLTAHENQLTRHALVASGQWLGVLAMVWVFSVVPFLSARLQLFWPEQIALLGMFGWHQAGLTSIVLGLLLLALCGRIYLLIRRLRMYFLNRHPQSQSAG